MLTVKSFLEILHHTLFFSHLTVTASAIADLNSPPRRQLALAHTIGGSSSTGLATTTVWHPLPTKSPSSYVRPSQQNFGSDCWPWRRAIDFIAESVTFRSPGLAQTGWFQNDEPPPPNHPTAQTKGQNLFFSLSLSFLHREGNPLSTPNRANQLLHRSTAPSHKRHSDPRLPARSLSLLR